MSMFSFILCRPTLTVSETLAEKYGDSLQQNMKGSKFEVVLQVLRAITGKRITRRGNFESYVLSALLSSLPSPDVIQSGQAQGSAYVIEGERRLPVSDGQVLLFCAAATDLHQVQQLHRGGILTPQ